MRSWSCIQNHDWDCNLIVFTFVKIKFEFIYLFPQGTSKSAVKMLETWQKL